MALRFELTAVGAGMVLQRSLELLAELESHDPDELPGGVVEETQRLRAVVDEWVEWTDIEEMQDGCDSQE